MLTTAQAAARLGISRQRILVLIRTARLPAVKFGRDYQIKEQDLKLVENRPQGYPKGRPRRK